MTTVKTIYDALQWRHNELDGVSDTSLTIVYSTVYSATDQRKHQSSAPLAFVRGIHRWPMNSPHKGPVTRKMFLFNDVIMGICGNSMSSSCSYHVAEYVLFRIRHCNWIKIPILSADTLDFYKQYVTSRKGPLMHNTAAYTGHVKNIKTWVIDEYNNKWWES